MNKTIILDAGHSLSIPGALANHTAEAKEAIKIRDLLVPLLKQNFTVASVPDNLNLLDSINWVNKNYPSLNAGLALAIHLNVGGGRASGAETFYYADKERSRKIAQTIIDNYCRLTGFRNRGAKPDDRTRYRRLGWIRDTKPWSCIIECCFIDNPEDLKKLQADYQAIAQALYIAICAVYGIKPLI